MKRECNKVWRYVRECSKCGQLITLNFGHCMDRKRRELNRKFTAHEAKCDGAKEE